MTVMATVIFGEGGVIWTLTTDRGRLAPWVATGTLITQVISMEDFKNGQFSNHSINFGKFYNQGLFF